MEVKTKIIMKLSDLLQRGEAVTAALSLQPNSIAKPRRKFDNVCRRTPIFEMYQNPSPRTLKPLSYPAELRGTLTFPCYPANSSIIKCSCYQFSDDSGSLCCDILDFDPKMIGRSIRVPSWNFIPSPKSESRESNDGFLEILSWCYLLPCNENSCSLSAVCFFCLNFGVCDIKENPKAKYLLFGEIRSISPVSTVPCSVLGSNSSNITGFLASIFICDCKFCNGAFSVLEWIRMCEEKIKDHSFKKAVTVYFCRLSSSWHPVVSRLIGDVVLVTRLKKKLVFTGKNESQLMYVTADDVSLHIPELFRNFRLIHPSDAQSKVEYGCYSGIITGVYMQGMVVELDQDVMLLLTDQHLSVPHSMRVGAIVTLKNVHFVDPKFRWGKMLILGACCRTSVILKSFSPLETRGYLKSNYQSLLQKFIDRLLFSTRLWALLLISCLRKKFTGILSDKEILGTKREEGLAQKYASSHLPQSTFLVRHGLLLEFFKHESYFGGQGVSSDLQLVLPIANLISYCESSWKSFLDKRENDVDLVGDIKPRTTISCGGKIYARSIRKVLHTEDTGIHVVGMLKISPTSGGLQLMDSTGFIDVILDLPVAPEIDEIFEAKNFTIIMEGIPEKLVHLDSLSHRQLSCRSTFTSDPITRMLKLRTYLYHKPIHGNSRFRPCSPFLDCERNLKELKCGNFQLLMLTYKFPREHKFQVHRANISSMFAQAIVLPWELHITEKNKVTDAIQLSLDHLRSFRENFATYERCLTRKRYKLEHALTNSLGFGSDDTGNRFCVDPCTSSIDCHAENSFCILNYLQEFPCLIITRNVNDNGVGTLRNKNACQKFASCSKLPRDKEVLLEFSSERFCVFESLKIGGYYLFSDQEKDTAIIKTGNHQICPEKVFINLGTDFRSIVLSPVDGFQTSNIYTFAREFNSEINIIVPCNALNVLKSSIKGLPDGCTDTIVFDKEGFDTASKGGAIFDAPNLPSETTCSDYHLPEGKLVSLQGLIVALHDYKCCNFLAQSTHGTGDVCLPMFLRGNGSVCIHVSVDGHVARIIFDLSSQAHPIGLGPDTYATFHRILKLSGQNRFMMLPVSLITINYDSVMEEKCLDESKSTPATQDLQSGPVSNMVPAVLISELLQVSVLEQVKLHCRIVVVYILVLEKNRNVTVPESDTHSLLSAVHIPLAGFVVDDGSASCCCWADAERAMTMLGLESDHGQQCSLESCWAEIVGGFDTGTESPFLFTDECTEKCVKQHGRVVVKNHGAMLDPSWQDLKFYVEPDGVVEPSNEYLLRNLIANACSSKIWSITGNPMAPKAMKQLNEQLSRTDTRLPPLQSVWAASVCQANILSEARSLLEQLS